MDIKRTIKANGLTVKEVAEKMGITPVGLSQHINGNPSVEVLERIAAAIGCNVGDFFAPQPTNTITCPHCGKLIKVEKEGNNLKHLHHGTRIDTIQFSRRKK
ncbi:MAG: helix-turn-helix domain-containing protein [Alistipes shahii]|uniref:helix-turn-helix domain-containing protein n=1 Tax=Alistipes shahii TaxID=328814 RepID=UPI00399C9E2D